MKKPKYKIYKIDFGECPIEIVVQNVRTKELLQFNWLHVIRTKAAEEYGLVNPGLILAMIHAEANEPARKEMERWGNFMSKYPEAIYIMTHQ